MLPLILSSLLALLVSPASGPQDVPLEFVAEIRGEHVAPEAVKTGARGRAIGVLKGHRFTVEGTFTGLSSALRDLEKTPDDPGVHLHRGAAGETTHYFFGLRVTLNADERSGTFSGAVDLDDEQRALLLSNRLYVDIHTVQHGPGEVRDQWRPVDPDAAARLRAALAQPEPSVTSEACHASADSGA